MKWSDSWEPTFDDLDAEHEWRLDRPDEESVRLDLYRFPLSVAFDGDPTIPMISDDPEPEP